MMHTYNDWSVWLKCVNTTRQKPLLVLNYNLSSPQLSGGSLRICLFTQHVSFCVSYVALCVCVRASFLWPASLCPNCAEWFHTEVKQISKISMWKVIVCMLCLLNTFHPHPFVSHCIYHIDVLVCWVFYFYWKQLNWGKCVQNLRIKQIIFFFLFNKTAVIKKLV